MAKVRYLMKEQGRYYAQVAVPTDLKPYYTRANIKRALNTADHREAVDRLHGVVAAIKAEFATKRREIQEPAQFPMPWDGFTVDGWLSLPQAERDQREDAFIDAILLMEEKGEFARARAALIRYQAGQAVSTIPAAALDDLIRRANELMTISAHNPKTTYGDDIVRAVEAVGSVRTDEHARAQIERRAPLTFVPPNLVKLLRTSGSSARGLTLGEIVHEFMNDPKRANLSNETKRNYKPSNALMLAILKPTTDINDIKRPQITQLVDIVSYLPKGYDVTADLRALATATKEAIEMGDDVELTMVTTVNKYLANIQAVFAWALENQYITSNPALGIRLESTQTRGRDPFTAEQLARLFNRDYVADGLMWIPLIALFQGMRPNEIAQLRADEITEIDGVPSIRVQVDDGGDVRKRKLKGDGRSLKTASSKRDLPIHPALIRLGLLTFAENRRSAGKQQLFDTVNHKSGKHWGSVEAKFREWLADHGVHSARHTFYSFRHTFKDAMLAAGIPPEHQKALGGWSQGKSADVNYGRGFTPKLLQASCAAIKFDLPLLTSTQNPQEPEPT